MTVQDKPMTAVEPFNIPDPATSLTPMQEYLFDLNGYLVLEGAISPDDVAAMNATYDAIAAADIEGKGWFGRVGVSNSARQEGMIFEQLYEAGPVWEKLIDHPAWFNKVAHFVGSDDPENFDNHHGLLFIDECFGTIRRKGGAQRMHSGGHVGTIRTQYPVSRRQVPLRPDRHPDGPDGHRTRRRRDDGRAGQPQVQHQAPPDRADRDAWRGHLDRRRGRRDRMPPQGGRRPAVRGRHRPRLQPADQSGRRASGSELSLRTELGLLPLPLPPECGAARPLDAAASPDDPAAWRVVTPPAPPPF